MIGLVRAEIMKLRNTTMPWMMGVVVAVFTVGSSLIIFHRAAAFAHLGLPGFPGSSTPPAWGTPTGPTELRELVESILEFGGYVLPIVFGALVATGDYRYRTIANAFLITPYRPAVFLAKAITSALGALFLALTSLVVMAAVDMPFLARQGGSVPDLVHQSTHVVPGMLGAFMLLGIVGCGVGTLVRSQAGALVGVLAWFAIGEQVVWENFPWIGRWMFELSTLALANPNGPGVRPGSSLLPWWAGAALLFLYGIALLVLGLLVSTWRDVT